MKKINYLITSLFVLSSFVVAPLSFAHETDEPHDEPSTTTSTDDEATTTNDDTEEIKINESSEIRKKRIADRKKQHQTKLTEIENQRIKAKCSSAQGKITSVTNRGQTSAKRYTNAYQKISQRLETLADNLSTSGLNLDELKAQQAELKTKIDAFEANLTVYFESLSDLKNMDCMADPEGFKASVQSARNSRKALQDEAKAIKTYLQQTIKATLNNLKDQLKTSEENDGQ